MMRQGPMVLSLRYAAILVFSALALLPIYAAVVGSLTPFDKLGNQAIFPAEFHWQNYVRVWERIPLLQHLRASLIYSVSVGALVVISAAPAGYSLSRFRFTGQRLYIYFVLVTQVIPLVIIVIPLFLVINALGLFDTYLAVIMTVTAVTLPFPILLLRSYFDTLPPDLEEAAMVDGCTRLGALIKIVVPLSGPGILTAFALAFFTAWQQFLIPLVLTESAAKVPVTVGIFRLADAYVVPWHLVMTGALLSSIPPVVVYLLAQRFLTQGLAAGGVKG